MMEYTAVQVRAAATRFGGETREMLDAYAAMLDVTDADAAAAIRTLLNDETRLFPDELDTVIAAYRSKAEAHSLATSDYLRVCRQLEVNGKIHDAEVERLLGVEKNLNHAIDELGNLGDGYVRECDNLFKRVLPLNREVERLQARVAELEGSER